MIFWLVLELEISVRVMISWRVLVSFRGFFFEDYICAWWNIWISIILVFNVNGKVTMWHTPCLLLGKCYKKLIYKPILQAKWSNKQKTKVLCIKVHFVHFYLSNECCVKRHSSFPQLVCVCFIYFTHTKGQNPKPFFSFGGGWEHHLQVR